MERFKCFTFVTPLPFQAQLRENEGVMCIMGDAVATDVRAEETTLKSFNGRTVAKGEFICPRHDERHVGKGSQTWLAPSFTTFPILISQIEMFCVSREDYFSPLLSLSSKLFQSTTTAQLSGYC